VESPFFQEEGFDADDVFRAFFNAYGMDGRVYVNRFGSQRRAQQRRAGAGRKAARSPLRHPSAAALLPVLFFFLAPAADPLYKSFSTPPYSVELRTSRWGVPYYIKSREDFSKSYPLGSASSVAGGTEHRVGSSGEVGVLLLPREDSEVTGLPLGERRAS